MPTELISQRHWPSHDVYTSLREVKEGIEEYINNARRDPLYVSPHTAEYSIDNRTRM